MTRNTMPEPEPVSDSATSNSRPDFDALVQHQLDKHKLPGASFSLVHGKTIWSKGYGLADLSTGRDIDANITLHYSASTTKAFLTTARALYINSNANKRKPDHEKISFSTSLSKIIRDDSVLPNPFSTERVTLEDVLSMRSGMARHELAYGREEAYTPRDVVRNLRNLPVHTELRMEFEYCNTGYVAASHALEVVTGRPLVDVLREWIWEPLGMGSTFGGYDEVVARGQEGRMAKGYTWSKLPHHEDFGDGEFRAEEPMDLRPVSGAGYMISTGDDYVKWLKALLSRSDLNPITVEITKECFSPRMICPPTGVSEAIFDGGHLLYALGWFVASYKGHRIVYHPGGLVGGGSRVLLCPSIKFGTSFLSNGFGAGERLASLQLWLLDRALGLGEKECDGFEKRKAQSRIGEDGQVQAFGIGMEPAMRDELFWFDRKDRRKVEN
ncbi:hypothetical protein CLAFUW4_02254 [Fulvia fulva]|nr:hypothetical protein CLAFUR4_02249 [Fulvia fulva]WPV09364.1 hypothetical protein CLAFUW4_02254 [Fulvia fulva]WPV23195.1 hypothetical protein CLAFUW7_02254 [Fulvia fulva]